MTLLAINQMSRSNSYLRVPVILVALSIWGRAAILLNVRLPVLPCLGTCVHVPHGYTFEPVNSNEGSAYSLSLSLSLSSLSLELRSSS